MPAAGTGHRNGQGMVSGGVCLAARHWFGCPLLQRRLAGQRVVRRWGECWKVQNIGITFKCSCYLFYEFMFLSHVCILLYYDY